MFRSLPKRLLPFGFLLLCAVNSHAQMQLLDQRWQVLRSENFYLISEVSASQTERLAGELEFWRKVASRVLGRVDFFPKAAVDNYVYVLANPESLQWFVYNNEAGGFYPSPRRNFMVLVYGDAESLELGRHHYMHFLMRNFTDLRIPRWYEEAIASYLADLDVSTNEARLRSVSDREFELSLRLSPEVTVEELLFDESELASPRRIQIANMKSEALLYFLLHGPEENFTDRRTQLQRYLDLSLQGRTQRFAYDQGFDLTTAQLDLEYERYLQVSRGPRGILHYGSLAAEKPLQAMRADAMTVNLALAELALNTGKFEVARQFFAESLERQLTQARSITGLADALRMQGDEELKEVLDDYYRRALEISPDEVDILLDFGEYWESVMLDCDRSLSAAEKQSIKVEILRVFSRVLELQTDNAEANLAMGQYYLLEGEDFSEGLPYQQKALSLLPADSFIMEQAIRYLIELEQFDEAERLLGELSQPLHFFGEPDWVSSLRARLTSKRQGAIYDACAD